MSTALEHFVGPADAEHKKTALAGLRECLRSFLEKAGSSAVEDAHVLGAEFARQLAQEFNGFTQAGEPSKVAQHPLVVYALGPEAGDGALKSLRSNYTSLDEILMDLKELSPGIEDEFNKGDPTTPMPWD